MFRWSQDKQMTMSDRLVFANEQTRKAVDASRAKLVGDIIYPNVDEARFAGLYSDKVSRPNIEIAQYVSALVVKRMYNLSDENFMEFLRCGAQNFRAEPLRDERHLQIAAVAVVRHAAEVHDAVGVERRGVSLRVKGNANCAGNGSWRGVSVGGVCHIADFSQNFLGVFR